MKKHTIEGLILANFKTHYKVTVIENSMELGYGQTELSGREMRIQKALTSTVNWSSTGHQDNSANGAGKHLDIQMRKNEAAPLSHTICRNSHKMNQRLKFKV